MNRRASIVVCLDCAAVIEKGPYRRRRTFKHLRLRYHDHPAATSMTPEEYADWMTGDGRFRWAGIVGSLGHTSEVPR